ncbi:hypothetical protein [Cobetia crustatorum]|uniref:hypothetical protein n=1 Tax=Cobetia crustatorum TaxID=553385 RepID=UPI0004BB81F2|nr:hypothetical protein [Cobetia crustatorum]
MTHFLKQLIRPLSVLSLSALMTMSPLAAAASQEPDVLLRDTVEGLTTKIDSRESYYKDNINELEGWWIPRSSRSWIIAISRQA